VSQIRTVVKALAASVAFGASASQATTDAPSTVFDEDVRVVRFVDMSYPLIAGVAGIQGTRRGRARLGGQCCFWQPGSCGAVRGERQEVAVREWVTVSYRRVSVYTN
jgi:hypothetical protein